MLSPIFLSEFCPPTASSLSISRGISGWKGSDWQRHNRSIIITLSQLLIRVAGELWKPVTACYSVAISFSDFCLGGIFAPRHLILSSMYRGDKLLCDCSRNLPALSEHKIQPNSFPCVCHTAAAASAEPGGITVLEDFTPLTYNVAVAPALNRQSVTSITEAKYSWKCGNTEYDKAQVILTRFCLCASPTERLLDQTRGASVPLHVLAWARRAVSRHRSAGLHTASESLHAPWRRPCGGPLQVARCSSTPNVHRESTTGSQRQNRMNVIRIFCSGRINFIIKDYDYSKYEE